LRLLQAFRVEQSDPSRFYGLLAADSVEALHEHGPLSGMTVLDVGAGRPEFAQAFSEVGARYVALDVDLSMIHGTQRLGVALCARGEALPIRTGSIDICFSSNVVEHVRNPWGMCDELVRVTRPGGLVFVSYTNWLSPWGGHETSPYHLVDADWALDRYTRRYGHAPKNRIDVNLFPVSVADGLRWAQGHPHATVLEARPRYHPSWAQSLVRIPGLRELATWNLLILMRRR
jgi:SAM-dependent methyltransferase